ncbi:WbqC family protein [Mucilaginibacter sp. HMF5004]|uniref:WbqC family protein n=1 Tax=Mucilaginibacter rivuli TaxID=2857527 RepID=UPI001C5EABBF|nr:WbqC family protein [Mucilaginibacter rivuli]MBW4891652.1 WbqC family protein [Mucilaginibacter rivuli]
MTEAGAVLPMFYLPPVEYFIQLNKHKANILIEHEEHLVKQSYRNRAHIYSPDGLLPLTVPVVKGSKTHTKVKDVKISYDFKWQRLHWMSLQNCYRRSTYFEFYEDDYAPFYEKRFEYLFDFNEQLFNTILKQVKIKANLKFTEEYMPAYPDMADLRASLDPKKPITTGQKPYFQLFEERCGFLENLSIVDLLFNHGPQAASYLAPYPPEGGIEKL